MEKMGLNREGWVTEPAAAHLLLLLLLPLGDKACTMHMKKILFGCGFEMSKKKSKYFKGIMQQCICQTFKEISLSYADCRLSNSNGRKMSWRRCRAEPPES